MLYTMKCFVGRVACYILSMCSTSYTSLKPGVCCDPIYTLLPQNKSDRTVSYSTQPMRPVHDRLGVRHPNKTLNKTMVENSGDDKNEKVMFL